MREWSFLTNHARALLLVAQDPSTRLRDIAAALEVTERTAFDLMVDLTEAGYLVKEKDGRRNRYHLQAHLPLRETIGRERSIGELIDLFSEKPKRPRSRPSAETS